MSHGLPREKFVVIPNGIDLAEADGAGPAPRGEVPGILCVANFRPRKRHRDLIEALGLLQARGVKVRCRLVGDGATRGEAEALARARGLGEAVEFVGTRGAEEVQRLLRDADVFVLASLWEACR